MLVLKEGTVTLPFSLKFSTFIVVSDNRGFFFVSGYVSTAVGFLKIKKVLRMRFATIA